MASKLSMHNQIAIIDKYVPRKTISFFLKKMYPVLWHSCCVRKNIGENFEKNVELKRTTVDISLYEKAIEVQMCIWSCVSVYVHL